MDIRGISTRGGGGFSTQSWVSAVKLIEKAVAVNLHTEGAVTFPYSTIPFYQMFTMTKYLNKIIELWKEVSTYFPKTMFRTISTILPPSIMKMFRKTSQN